MQLRAATKPTDANFVRVIRKMVQSIKVVTNHSIGTCSLDYIVYILKLRERKGYMRLRSRLKRMSKPQNATNVKHSRKGAARESFARGLKPNSSVVNCCGGLGLQTLD